MSGRKADGWAVYDKRGRRVRVDGIHEYRYMALSRLETRVGGPRTTDNGPWESWRRRAAAEIKRRGYTVRPVRVVPMEGCEDY